MPLARIAEQAGGLALEALPRGKQEAQIDHHKEGRGGEPLHRLGDLADIGGRVELLDQLGHRRRHRDAEGAGQMRDHRVQLRRIAVELAKEAAGVGGHHEGRQAEQHHRNDDGQRHGGDGRELQPAPQYAREGIDHDHQEERQRQRRQDGAQPIDGRAGDHDGDHDERVSPRGRWGRLVLFRHLEALRLRGDSPERRPLRQWPIHGDGRSGSP